MRIQKGERLATIGDPDNTHQLPVLASRDGHIIGHSNVPLVNLGDALFHIGY